MPDRVKLQRNFHEDEFLCRCDGQFCDGGERDLIELVARHSQRLRDTASAALGFEVGLHIERGNSCEEYNDTIVGASELSHHMYDMWPPGHGGIDTWPFIPGEPLDPHWLRPTLVIVARVAYSQGWRGIKIYPGHLHLDRRNAPWLVNFEPVYHIPI